MKILVLAGNYDPKPDANGTCIKAIIEQFKKNKIEVHIICLGYMDEQKYFDLDPQTHHILTNRPVSFREMEGIKKVLYVLKRLLLLPFWPMIRPKLMARYYNLGLRLFRQHNFEAIISVQNPIETVEAGYKIKKKYPQTKFAVYTMDPVTNSYKNIDSPLFKYLSRRWEKKIFDGANAIFPLECHRNHYTQKEYAKYHNLIEFVDVPLFQVDTTKKETFVKEENNNNAIKLIYSGAFYHKLREPFYLLKCFKEIIRQNEKVEIHFYTSGAFEELIKEEANRSNGKIFAHGYVDPKTLDLAIQESNILLSVGNSATEMVPSKIFMYMSTGKPIIHFYQSEQDICLMYFQQYPLSLMINEKNKILNNTTIFKSFLLNNYNNSVKVEKLKLLFLKNNPKYSTNIIMSKLFNRM